MEARSWRQGQVLSCRKRQDLQITRAREEDKSPQITQYMAPQARWQQVPTEPLQGAVLVQSYDSL